MSWRQRIIGLLRRQRGSPGQTPSAGRQSNAPGQSVFDRSAPGDHPDEVYVSLQELIALNLPLARSSRRQHQLVWQGSFGSLASAHTGQGIEFAGLRRYAADDDARHIDWRASARQRVPLLRQFTEDRERRICLLIDQRCSMFFGSAGAFKSVRASRLAAQLAWLALRQGQWINAILLGDTIDCLRAGRSRAHVIALLQRLTDLNRSLHAASAQGPALDEAVRRSGETVQGGTSLVILSDFADLDRDCCNRLLLLRRRCPVTLVVIEDALETQLPLRGAIGMADATQATVVQIDRHVVAHYQRIRNARQALIDGLRAGGIEIVDDAEWRRREDTTPVPASPFNAIRPDPQQMAGHAPHLRRDYPDESSPPDSLAPGRGESGQREPFP